MEHLDIYLHVVDIYDWISIVLKTVLVIFVARLPQTIQKNMPRDVFYTNPSHLKYCSPVTSTSFQPSHHVVGVRFFQHQRENLPTQVLQSDLSSPSCRQFNLWNCHLTNPQKRHKNCQGPKIKCKIIPWCHAIPSQASLWKETATQKTAHLWPQRSFWQKGQSSVFPRTHLLHCYIRLFPGNNLQSIVK